MTPVEQLDYVERYFAPYRGKLRDLSDLYMAILWPKGVGKPASYVLFSQGSREYQQNRGLDANNDGVVSKTEAARSRDDRQPCSLLAKASTSSIQCSTC